MARKKRKEKTQKQIRQDDKAFCRWHKLTCIAKNGKKILIRSPTKANVDIIANVYRKKNCKNIKISQIKC